MHPLYSKYIFSFKFFPVCDSYTSSDFITQSKHYDFANAPLTHTCSSLSRLSSVKRTNNTYPCIYYAKMPDCAFYQPDIQLLKSSTVFLTTKDLIDSDQPSNISLDLIKHSTFDSKIIYIICSPENQSVYLRFNYTKTSDNIDYDSEVIAYYHQYLSDFLYTGHTSTFNEIEVQPVELKSKSSYLSSLIYTH
jgi:hypothetical protein